MYLILSLLILAVITVVISINCIIKNITFNKVEQIINGKAPYVEGSYVEEINAEEFIKLTGVDFINILPEKFKKLKVSYQIAYDMDDKIRKASAYNIMDSSGRIRYPMIIELHSKTLWSRFFVNNTGYKYKYQKVKISNINGVNVICSIYKEEYNTYYADFQIDEINIHIESKIMTESEFLNFCERFIEYFKAE